MVFYVCPLLVVCRGDDGRCQRRVGKVAQDFRAATGEAVSIVIDNALEHMEGEPEDVDSLWRSVVGVVGPVHSDCYVSAGTVAFERIVNGGVAASITRCGISRLASAVCCQESCVHFLAGSEKYLTTSDCFLVFRVRILRAVRVNQVPFNQVPFSTKYTRCWKTCTQHVLLLLCGYSCPICTRT